MIRSKNDDAFTVYGPLGKLSLLGPCLHVSVACLVSEYLKSAMTKYRRGWHKSYRQEGQPVSQSVSISVEGG